MIIPSLLLALSLFIAALHSQTDPASSSELFFVASDQELTVALGNEEKLHGLAISIVFYKSVSLETQGKIDHIVKRIIANKYPVFLYGQPFDRKIAERLLVVGDKSEDGSDCTPTAFAGIVVLEKDGPCMMCGADDNNRSDQSFRDWLSEHWKHAKKQLESN